MIRNIKGQIVKTRKWMEDAHLVYIALVANRLEIDAMFKESFKQR